MDLLSRIHSCLKDCEILYRLSLEVLNAMIKNKQSLVKAVIQQGLLEEAVGIQPKHPNSSKQFFLFLFLVLKNQKNLNFLGQNFISKKVNK